MNKSSRIYITLNPKKHKDKIILDYLNANYSCSETIKSVLYSIATNRCNEVNLKDNKLKIEVNEEVQNSDKCTEEVQKGVDIKSEVKPEVEVDEDIKNLFS